MSTTDADIVDANSLDIDQFCADYLHRAQPVVIRNHVTSWPAFTHWNFNYLKSKVGDNVVHIRRHTNKHEYKVGKCYDIEQTTLAAYLDNVQMESAKAKGSYLAVQNIKQTFPQLENDVIIPKYVGKMHGGPFMWIAFRGHYEFCHFDPDDNFLAMIRGRKRVRLYGCKVKPLYPNPLGSKGRTIQSQVDCDNPDYQKFPLFKDSQCSEYILESGDMLFIPAFCWHQVTSLDTSISINMFYGDDGDCNFISKIMKEPYWDAFSYWFLNIIEQNRSLDSFQRILANLPDSIDNFFLKQYHETNITADIRNKLIQVVLDYCKLKELPPAEVRNGKHPPALKIRGLLWRK